VIILAWRVGATLTMRPSMRRLLEFVTLLAPSLACSLQPHKGIQISAIDQTSSRGRLSSNSVRLQLSKPGISTQVVLDFATGALTRHDDTLEFMPTVDGFVETASGTFDPLISTANVSWASSGAASVVLPNASAAIWWYSGVHQKLFFAYRTATASRVAACTPVATGGTISTANAACVHADAEGSHSFDFYESGAAQVWEGEGLVALPVPCCICISWDYYSFGLTGMSNALGGALRPSLAWISPLSSLGPKHFDTGREEVWATDGADTGYADALLVTRYRYATRQSASVSLSDTDLAAAFGDEGKPRRRWLRLLLPLGALAVVVAVVATFCVHRRRRSFATHTATTKGLPPEAPMVQGIAIASASEASKPIYVPPSQPAC